MQGSDNYGVGVLLGHLDLIGNSSLRTSTASGYLAGEGLSNGLAKKRRSEMVGLCEGCRGKEMAVNCGYGGGLNHEWLGEKVQYAPHPRCLILIKLLSSVHPHFDVFFFGQVAADEPGMAVGIDRVVPLAVPVGRHAAAQIASIGIVGGRGQLEGLEDVHTNGVQRKICASHVRHLRPIFHVCKINCFCRFAKVRQWRRRHDFNHAVGLSVGIFGRKIPAIDHIGDGCLLIRVAGTTINFIGPVIAVVGFPKVGDIVHVPGGRPERNTPVDKALMVLRILQGNYPNLCRFIMHTTDLLRWRALFNAGRGTTYNSTTMPIATSNSVRVNALIFFCFIIHLSRGPFFMGPIII